MIESPYWQGVLLGVVTGITLAPFLFFVIYIVAEFFSKKFKKRR